MAHGENAPLNITPGAIRFNTDSMKLEYFRIGMEGGSTSSYAGIGTLAAGEWVQITTDTPDIQTGYVGVGSTSHGSGTRGLYAGGSGTPTWLSAIDYVNVDTTGNAINFGDLSDTSYEGSGLGNRTRGLFALGYAVPDTDTIDMVTIASTGSTEDFGNLHTGAARVTDTLANETRGIFAGAETPSRVNDIRYVTIASKGDTVDFGDMTVTKGLGTGCASSTRGLLGGGRNPPTSYNIIDYIAISTLGNAADFGDLTQGRHGLSAGSNSIRGVFGGAATENTIDYVTIPTLGNAIDFGNLTSSRNPRAMASSTRVAFAGGNTGSQVNTIDYVQIMSTGNAADFGDLTNVGHSGMSCSNGHGGLG